ncbi:MAG: hypothetical protein ACRCZC_00920 [Culicoidibacterales bacterium]
MISKKQFLVFCGIFVIIVVIVSTLTTTLSNQQSNAAPSVPRVIETSEVIIEVVQIKQLANVVTVQLSIENRKETDLVIKNEQLLLSVEPYYQDHVHEATKVKTLDYNGANVIPAQTIREVIVEFDANHEITTDYFMLYLQEQAPGEEQVFYSLILS